MSEIHLEDIRDFVDKEGDEALRAGELEAEHELGIDQDAAGANMLGDGGQRTLQHLVDGREVPRGGLATVSACDAAQGAQCHRPPLLETRVRVLVGRVQQPAAKHVHDGVAIRGLCLGGHGDTLARHKKRHTR